MAKEDNYVGFVDGNKDGLTIEASKGTKSDEEDQEYLKRKKKINSTDFGI